ncbi:MULTISPECIES: hypothetical protein [Marivita]|uniref:Lipoprotein n=1 Tax=Marivita cryptomonadis TaxID=505252 RepID=A0A9Q2NWH3_9RHOB|nr:MULTISPECIES: hypothetical protein [Marivita]MCR9168746.1 hypothetical protein [Paracoccaceae bacterium]MBM2321034.1 hypothetical protein [Marivita cryptomonadis]MBM2330615.1 hypothetical protein [Marivita cryptomonadis]MBM2340201.1 hypothetical protein [Marivita cryptomonadis]MBM2344863.1 hypothetical protein [Marivita cryptomonadis]
MKILVQSLALMAVLTACVEQAEVPFIPVSPQPVSPAAMSNSVTALRSMLNDPASLRITYTATFASDTGSFQLVCITFSARNSFNGMSPPNYFGATLFNGVVRDAKIESRFATYECSTAMREGRLYL